MNNADLSQLSHRAVPAFPGWWAALGPGVVWMALAQGSGELIWWPYMVAKYGLTFLWFGAFASAGGTAMAELTHWPIGSDNLISGILI